MTEKEKRLISYYRSKGNGYKRIASLTGISVSSIKYYCRAHPIENDEYSRCLNCGAPLVQNPHKKQKKFCSDKCRNAWWNHNPEKRIKELPYKNVCSFCGSKYESSRKTSRYCSSACFYSSRKVVARDGKKS